MRMMTAVDSRARRDDEMISADLADAPSAAVVDVDRTRTRVLVVDDHRAFAEAIAIAIGLLDDLLGVRTGGSIAEALELVAQEPPDVILLDVRLPDGDGIAAIGRLRAASPGTRIVILTGFTDVDVLARAAAAGAGGFLPKESPVSAVIRAIRAARDGDLMVEGSTLAAILGRVGSFGSASRSGDDDPPMTPRERDVLALMGQGLDPHAIASALRISLHTCRGYQKAIMAKLETHSQLEAVVVASRRGLIPRVTA